MARNPHYVPRGHLGGASSFSRNVNRWARGSRIALEHIHTELLLLGLRIAVQETPVLSGRARASWRVSKGRPDLSKDTRPDLGSLGHSAAAAAGDATLVRQFAKARRLRAGGDVWITNNVHYAIPLEDGYSTKGRAMLRRAFGTLLGELPRIVAEARRKVDFR